MPQNNLLIENQTRKSKSPDEKIKNESNIFTPNLSKNNNQINTTQKKKQLTIKNLEINLEPQIVNSNHKYHHFLLVLKKY